MTHKAVTQKAPRAKALRRPELHTLAGAYVLDALTARDRARFEQHLSRCQSCASETGELREATARLAGMIAADPPASLIKHVVASAARVRQLPPAVGEPRSSRHVVHQGSDAGVPGVASGRRRSPRPAVALAGLFLAVATALGAIAFNAEQQIGAAGLRSHEIAQVLNAPDAVMLTAHIAAGGTATVVMSDRDRALVFTTAGLPRLPTARRYELWLMGPEGDRSAGMLPPPRDGMTSPVFAAGIAPGDRVGLTIEPEGGSPHPTSTPILLLPLSA